MRKLFRGRGVLVASIALMVAMVLSMAMPVFAVAPTYINVEGVYTVTSSVSVTYLDGTHHPSNIGGTLVIVQDNQVLTGYLTMLGGEVTLTGLIGSGTKPYIVLVGTNDDGTAVGIHAGLVISHKTHNVTAISGQIDGFVTSDGERWDDSTTGTAVISTAYAYSGAYSTLLTADAGAGAVCVQFDNPINTLKLSQMDTLKAGKNGISFWYKLQSSKSPGPQIGLRFAPKGEKGTDLFSSVNHVDITLGPLYSTTGTGNWTQCVVTYNSTRAGYFGNNASGSGFSGGLFVGNSSCTLADMEALIAASDPGEKVSNWVLTAVYIDLYEAGNRTCYIDDVQIGTTTYSLEPNKFDGAFQAKWVSVLIPD